MWHSSRRSERRPLRRLRTLLLVVPSLGWAGCSDAPLPTSGSVVSEPPAVVAGDSAAVVAAVRAGYRERLRLGLGSPFRLAEQALLDPRLDGRARGETAAELVERTLRGDAYQLDAGALLPAGAGALPVRMRVAAEHLELIESTVGGASDPRAGELAVRLAYRLALTERTVDTATFSSATRIASLARDRRIARQDARQLVAAARAQGVHPVRLVERWRRERRFAVERPALQPLPVHLEREAIAAAPSLLADIHTLWLRAPRGWQLPAPPPGELERLRGLREVADSFPLPPSPVVTVAVRRTRLPDGPVLPEAARAAWEAFEAAALDEERFVAAYGEMLLRYPSLRVALARSALHAAVGLRSLHQERPWFPGMPGPSAEELRVRYGVRVQMDPELPDAWGPYYRGLLDDALAELRTIFPSLFLEGLRVRVTPESTQSGALASHTGRGRILEWPASTGPGVLAHELAHDLDWQASRRKYRAPGYASDRAVARGEAPVATALASLTPDPRSIPKEGSVRGEAHVTRPAEVLARNFEWFVVTRLAARGRSNGVLSSAQDEVLTGHGSLTPPGGSAAYGRAVVTALSPLLPIPTVERRGFLSDYGPGRWPSAYLFVRASVLRLDESAGAASAADTLLGPLQRLGKVRQARDAALVALDEWLCSQPAPLVDRTLYAGYRGLVAQAASARARAEALATAERLGGAPGRSWVMRQLFGLFWPEPELDPHLRGTLEGLVGEVREISSLPELPASSAFDLHPAVSACAAGTLPAATVFH